MPMPPMSLLTSNDAPFPSFLANMDHNEDAVAPEWSYAPNPLINIDEGPQDRDSLAKATKDLMSLDPDRWRNSRQQRPAPIAEPTLLQHIRTQPHPSDTSAYDSGYGQPHLSSRRRNEVFPFLTRHPSENRAMPDHHEPPPGHLQNPPLMVQQHQHHHQHHMTERPSINPHQPTNELNHNVYPPPRLTAPSLSTNSVSPPPTSGSSSSSVPHFPPSQSGPSTRSQSSQPKRARDPNPAPDPVVAKRSRTSASTKTGLLSPSQKKANHIQSEQKRRANIRRGYETLCECVPALRAAIREEEMASEALDEVSSSRAKSKKGKGTKSKDADDTEKIDGRAGPRSENIVLSKTIDYLSELVNGQTALLQRLESARAMLPPGHPLREPPSTPPLWERQWTGGEGRMEADDDEEDD